MEYFRWKYGDTKRPLHPQPDALFWRPRLILEQGGDQSGPAGLVTCSQPAAGVPVEVLVEEDVVTPVRVVRVACEGAVARPRPALLWHEQ